MSYSVHMNARTEIAKKSPPTTLCLVQKQTPDASINTVAYKAIVRQRFRQSMRFVCATYMHDCWITRWPPGGCGIGAVVATPGCGITIGRVMSGGDPCGTVSMGGGGRVCAMQGIAQIAKTVVNRIFDVFMWSLPDWRHCNAGGHCARNWVRSLL